MWMADDVEVFETWTGVGFAEALAKSEPVSGSMVVPWLR
jgi:hypothetical protein